MTDVQQKSHSKVAQQKSATKVYACRQGFNDENGVSVILVHDLQTNNNVLVFYSYCLSPFSPSLAVFLSCGLLTYLLTLSQSLHDDRGLAEMNESNSSASSNLGSNVTGCLKSNSITLSWSQTDLKLVADLQRAGIWPII